MSAADPHPIGSVRTLVQKGRKVKVLERWGTTAGAYLWKVKFSDGPESSQWRDANYGFWVEGRELEDFQEGKLLMGPAP